MHIPIYIGLLCLHEDDRTQHATLTATLNVTYCTVEAIAAELQVYTYTDTD